MRPTLLHLNAPKNTGQCQLLVPHPSGISSGLGSSCKAVQQLVSDILPWKSLHNRHPDFNTVSRNNSFSLY